ncbi:hypothetical protein CEY00_Acc13004 [Actinidia chinensis var. chinensis]|uniref:Uncharacterized protein n=1 Tax=Actinidia chinensis var. chinensis TaxID=1590841 RepID=A0A2R6QUT5_ACTCC|nr:hypothetical protein CEY00_Acc13004 [Actinidia chinensis var. chinensis]
MSRLPEITDLFARLASNLETLNPTATNEDQEAIDLSISHLNQSLNLEDSSRVRVLDTALSLMCFRAPQVFDSVIEYLVKTIVTVLSSSITCKAFRFGKAEFLRVGSRVSSRDCAGLIGACAAVLGKLEGHGLLSQSLLYAVVRVAVSASCFRFGLEITPILDVKSIEGGTPTVLKLLSRFPRDISFENQQIPLRLLLWYLDPLILKNDVSNILQDVIRRPFLCLKVAFHERTDWNSIIICLALSPATFVETRALLHNWFLMTGLASVLELQIELVSLILDVVSRPMWWGLTMDIGLKLPFSYAYFLHHHQLLRTLDGPLSCQNLLCLVRSTIKPASHSMRHSDSPLTQHAATKIGMINYKSQWSMAMNFPDWFYFALTVLFSGKSLHDNFHSEGTVEAAEPGHSHDPKLPCSTAAAQYIAWVLSPTSESHQELLVECLAKISESWALKKCTDKHNKETSGYRKKLKKIKFQDKTDDCALLQEYDCKTIALWLGEFQDTHASQGNSLQQNVLFRRISLGILIGCSNGINEDGCQLLLHYAATGNFLPLTETQIAGLKHRNWNSQRQDDSTAWFEKCNIKEAVAGTCLVFHLTDAVESMSTSLFENEERGIDFICRVKIRARKYLLNCVKKLICIKIDEEDGFLMLRDLCSRLARWRQQGKDVFQGSKDLDDAVDALSHKLSSIQTVSA